MLLTGQRRSEVAGTPWDELDLDPERRVWHLPGARTKNRHPIDVHLSDLALAVIRSIPRGTPLPNRPDFMFTTTRCGPVTGFALVKQNHLNKWVGATDWVIHDVRRTFATGLARLGVPPHVADRALNHVSGTIKGVARVYNRFQYLPERKEALDKWAAFVADLIQPKEAPRQRIILRRPGEQLAAE